jgi:hypothetical protein
MKFIIILLTLTSLLSFIGNKPEPDKIIVLIDQTPSLRPIANTIETFWGDKEHFDTIQIIDRTLVAEINTTLKKLWPDRNASPISYESCIIRFSKGQPVDTFYSWRWFDYWKKGSTIYFDRTERLSGLFSKSYHPKLEK